MEEDATDPFGWELVLDLHQCNHGYISSRSHIEAFAVAVCEELGVRRYGPPAIERFGVARPETLGFSLVQLIETSSIVAHFSEKSDTAFVNVFSCRALSAEAVARFVAAYFGSREYNVQLLVRR